MPHRKQQSANVTRRIVLKPHVATLARSFVQPMFTNRRRLTAGLDTRSPFACARVKSARRSGLIECPAMPPAKGNRVET
jgi:hypothetical protein